MRRRRRPTNYERGRSREYRAAAELRSRGWSVLRSAGSKGAADLIAFKDGEILLVQVKSNQEQTRDALHRFRQDKQLFACIGIDARVSAEIWTAIKGKGFLPLAVEGDIE